MKKIKIIWKFFVRKYDLRNYKGFKNLHLGCGNKPLKDFLNVDLYNDKYTDQIIDLNKNLPFDDKTFDLIYSDNVFEHIKNLLLLIQESHRVLKDDGGILIIKVPYFKSKHAFVDPTHKNFFTVQSMDYYIKDTYFNNEYKFFLETFESIEIYLDPNRNGFIKRILELIAIKKPNFFENSILSSLFVFHNIVYVLRK